MITSSTDIFRTLAGDPLIAAIAKIRIIEGNPSLNPEDGVIIYVSKYPKTSEFEASWYIWIIDFDNEPLDVVISQIRRNFPSFQVLEDGAIVRGVLTEVKTTRTEIAPAAPQKISIEPYLEALNEKFEELRESIEDRMLLVNSGRPGRDGKDGKDGRPGRDGKDGVDLQATEVELGDLKDVYIDDAKKDQVLTYDGESWIAKYFDQRYNNGGGLTYEEIELLQGIKSTGEPMGFVDRADSEFSFDDTTRTLTLSPVGEKFVVWVKSKRFSIGEPVSVQVPDTTGLYFVYFDTEGNLEYQTDYFYWDSEAPAAYVYWDADANTCPYLADERHGIVLDWQTHEYLHRTRGAVIANGFGIYGYVLNGTGALDSDAEFSLSGGTFFDEDLEIAISHSETPEPNSTQQDLQGPAKVGVFYKIGSTWKLDAATNFAVKKATTRPYYNSSSGSTFGLTEVSNNRFVNYYIVATHNLRAPIIAIMGQAQYVNITDAQTEDFNSLNLNGFPSKEFRFLYKITFKTGNFTNTIHSVIASIQDLRNYSGQFVAALDIGSIRIDQLDAPIGPVSFGDQRIIDLGTPVDGSDAATKAYVDSAISTSDLNVSGDTGSISIDHATETLGILGGTGLSSLADTNSVTINLDNTSVSPGSYGSSTAIPTFTVDAQGRLTAAGTTGVSAILNIAADAGAGGSISLLNQTLTILGGTGLTSSTNNQNITINLDNTSVTAGEYGSASSVGKFTVDAQGRLTAASNQSIDIVHTQVSDFNAGVQQNRLDQLSAPTTSVNLNSQRIINLAEPTSASDAASKSYVDSVVQGLDIKQAVRVATTENITRSGTQTIDGISVVAGDRVLVKDQTTASENGIYIVSSSTWSRSNDADSTGELVTGSFVFVTSGVANGSSGWVLTTTGTITIGTTALTFTQFSGAGQINAGDGLTKTDNTINVVGATGRIVANADSIDLASGVIGTTGTYRSVTVDTYGRITAGTNPTTLSGYGITDAQPLNPDLTAIASLTDVLTINDYGQVANAATEYLDYNGITSEAAISLDYTSLASGFLYRISEGEWTLDTNVYLTNNQVITISGDATGSGATSINLTLANTGVSAGIYNNSSTSIRSFTVDAKGRITSVGSEVTITPAWSSITAKPTTLSGFGITDAQPVDADLTAIAAISDASGFLKKVAANTWTLDTNSYLTNNQNISISGDATGSGNTAINLILASTGVGAGTYTKVTVDIKGRVTAATNPTTLSGYGITDAQPLDADLTAIAGLAGASGFLKKTALNTWALDANTYLTGNQSITVSGDVSGSGTTAITLNLVNTGTAGTYTKVTTDSKGRVTSGTTLVASDIPTLTAAKISDFDTQVRSSRLDQLAAPTTSVSFNNQKITGLGSPTLDSDAATKAYVDAVKQGLDIKDSVRVATTENITLTGSQAIDGVTVIAGDRILVKNQATASENGIYLAATGTWTRALDANTSAKLGAGAFVFVSEGTSNADSGWVLTTNDPITLGTTSIVFTQFSGAGQITAGDGLTKSGNTINAVGTVGRIVVNADSIDLATTGVVSGSYNTVTVDDYGRVTAATSPTTLSGYGITDAQPLDADLTAIAGLTGASGFLKKTALNTWALDTNTYLTGNQSITVSGDVSGSGTTAITLNLVNTGTAGTYTKVTTDSKGRVISGTTLVASDIPVLTAAKISDFDTQVRNSRLDQMAAPTASVSLNSQKITALATPTASSDAATKAYVDTNAGVFRQVSTSYLDGTEQYRGLAAPSTALASQFSGAYNIAIGFNALNLTTNGINNIGIGFNSLRYNLVGSSNIGIGSFALEDCTANNNIAIGYRAASSTTTGYSNVAVGLYSLDSNTTGNRNIAIGGSTLYQNTTGFGSVAIGDICLYRNNGDMCVGVGYETLNLNTSGFWNTGIGGRALISNSTGSRGTAVGFESLFFNKDGNFNTAIGFRALHQVNQNSNTAIGAEAGFFITSGANNICVGILSGTDAVANLTTQSNYVVIGNNSTTNANIKVAWTITSDARDKCRIEPCTHGLAFVSRLKPVKYEYRASRDSIEPATDGRPRYGFLAQDILEVEQENPVIIDDRDPENLKFNEASLVPVLVNAINELREQVSVLTSRLAELEAK